MPDREKVIKALEDFNKNRICLPHLIPWDEIADAITLLKEQEDMGKELTDAMELIHKKNERIEKLLKEREAIKPFSDDDGAYWCGSCHEDMVWHQKFCSNCGKPVLWEGR